MMFINTMIIGTMIAVSSYSWLSMWIGLEINLLSLIPLISSNNNLYSSESAMKYFITQTLASSIILFSILLMSIKFEFISFNNNYSYMMTMFNSAILIKMGAAPFHFWFPEIMEGLNWFNSFIILTWQKIAPMIIFMTNIKLNMFTNIIIISSSIISGIMGINQTSMRKILSFSSINHISWMISTMMINQSIWLIYFSCYTIINLNLILMFYYLNIYYIQQLLMKINYNKMIKLFFIMNFLSLGGLPPFLGFLPKWLTINNLIMNNYFIISLILIIFSLITLFMYLRITFTSIMIYSTEMMFYQNKFNFLMFYLNMIMLISLIFCTMLFNMV
uniref:NADH-ubiquinone oxidoreductase chain 2 n=1 Tax=Cucujoidea sp. 9 KM-2017 TaxID=2219390 RepID=A0A346RJQ2_9CUCU|nr:NADH dehydrogenase subunit 2 [Cucujoidea sp. 9 KM-2017]